MEEGDLIRIDIPARRLDIVGAGGVEMTPQAVLDLLAKRRAAWKRPASRYSKGILGVYTRYSASGMQGGYLRPRAEEE